MFVERLFSVLSWPSRAFPDQGSGPSERAEVGAVDEALESRTLPARRRFDADLESRVLQKRVDEARAAWLLDLTEEGWLDEHLLDLHDVLLELAPELPTTDLERLIRVAMFSFLEEAGLDAPTLSSLASVVLTAAEAALLRRATQLVTSGACELEGLGLLRFAGRYACALGLIDRREAGEPGGALVARTHVGDAALRLTGGRLLAFLLGIEVRSSSGPGDRYRAPRIALVRMQGSPTFLVPTTGAARRRIDPEGILSWWRVRRLLRMGLCEAVPGSSPTEGGQEVYVFQLTRAGRVAITETLASIPEPHAVPTQFPLAATESGASAAIAPVSDTVRSGLPVPLHPHEPALPAAAMSIEAPLSEAPPLTPSSNPSGGGLRELELGPLLVRAWSELKVHRVQFELCGPTVCVLADRKALLCIFRELLRASAEAALHGASTPPSVFAQISADSDETWVTVEMDDSGPPLPSSFLSEPGALPGALGLFGVGDSSDEIELSLRRSLFRAVEDLHAQGGRLTFLPSRLGGASLRINLPRLPVLPHPIESPDSSSPSSGSLRPAA